MKKSNRIRILIVDDEAVFHELIPAFISKKSIEYFSAKDADDAFAILRAQEINCIFMDLVLPFRSGIGLTELIRQIYWNKLIYIIGMTGLSGGKEAEQCAAHGMNDFVRKPFDAEDIPKVFQRFLDTYQH